MNTNNLNYFDKIRHINGTDKTIEAFTGLMSTDQRRAINLINSSITFPSFFILIPVVDELSLRENLNLRNIIAIKICHQLFSQNNQDENDYLSEENAILHYPVLKWMLQTSYNESGLGDKFDKVIDVAVSYLIRLHHDKTILPYVAELIFNRNRKGYYTHDLVWAFFKSYDPYALILIAGYLRSKHQKDIELACNLLNIEAPDGKSAPKLYASYLRWLKENDPYLFFTNESFQQKSSPAHSNVDIVNKYLCKSIPYEKKYAKPFSDSELQQIDKFNAADDEEKQLLAEYSHNMHQKSKRTWDRWMTYTLTEQLSAAKNGYGGIR